MLCLQWKTDTPNLWHVYCEDFWGKISGLMGHDSTSGAQTVLPSTMRAHKYSRVTNWLLVAGQRSMVLHIYCRLEMGQGPWCWKMLGYMDKFFTSSDWVLFQHLICCQIEQNLCGLFEIYDLKIIIPIFRLVLHNFSPPDCLLYNLFCRYLPSSLSSGWFVIAVCGSISVDCKLV